MPTKTKPDETMTTRAESLRDLLRTARTWGSSESIRAAELVNLMKILETGTSDNSGGELWRAVTLGAPSRTLRPVLVKVNSDDPGFVPVEVDRFCRAPHERTVQNVTSTSVAGNVGRLPNSGALTPDPYDEPTPLLDAFGVELDAAGGVLAVPIWPEAAPAGPQTAEKTELPSTALAVSVAPYDPDSVGCVVDVSAQLDSMIAASGRVGDLVLKWLRSGTLRALEQSIAASLDSITPVTDFTAALADVSTVGSPVAVVGNVADLLTLGNLADLDRLGVQAVPSHTSTKTAVVAAGGITVHYHLEVLQRVEPSLLGREVAVAAVYQTVIDAARVSTFAVA